MLKPRSLAKDSIFEAFNAYKSGKKGQTSNPRKYLIRFVFFIELLRKKGVRKVQKRMKQVSLSVIDNAVWLLCMSQEHMPNYFRPCDCNGAWSAGMGGPWNEEDALACIGDRYDPW